MTAQESPEPSGSGLSATGGAHSDTGDVVAPYNVTRSPTGAAGPGAWPVETPTGEALEVLKDVVRGTDEPAIRRALEFVLTVVLIGVVVALTLLGQRLDDRVDHLENENVILQNQIFELSDRIHALETEAR